MRATVNFAITVYCLLLVTCHALVITAPSWEGNGGLTTKKNSKAKTKIERIDLDLRIRTTNEADIPEVANMLTYAILEQEDEVNGNQQQNLLSPLNFRFRNTRTKVTSLLQSRMKAITIGRKLMLEHGRKGILDDLTHAEQLRLLWSNDAFRNSMEKAASLSHEPHIWKDHIFHCAPPSFDWLFHKMITAENVLTGEVVGFCEIAMLSEPVLAETSRKELPSVDEECSLVDEEPGVPTFMNVVTSTNYRRRGVASKLVHSATSYVKKASFSSSAKDKMALYVEGGNHPAIKMYERLGFEKQETLESKGQSYMTQQIVLDPSRETLSKAKVEAFFPMI